MSYSIFKVSCVIDTYGNFNVINSQVIYKSVSKDIKKFFKENGIKLKIDIPGGKGAGIETLQEILKAFMDTQNFIALLLSIWGYINLFFSNYFANKTKYFRPRVKVYLFSNKTIDPESEISFTPDSWLEDFRDGAMNLISLSCGFCDLMATKHPHIRFDSTINLKSKNEYETSFSIDHEVRNEENINKILAMAANLIFVRNRNTHHTINKLNLIERTDRKIVFENTDGPNPSESITYYFLHSKKLFVEQTFYIKLKDEVNKWLLLTKLTLKYIFRKTPLVN